MAEDTPPGFRPTVRLNGWKEIATHLGRGVRTVQRWEKDFGLPVRRLGLGKGETVFAFSNELDEWLATSEAASARAESAGTLADTSEASEPSGNGEVDTHQNGTGPRTRAATPRTVWRRFALAIALVGCVALGIVGSHVVTSVWTAWKGTAGSTTRPSASPRAEPASLRADGCSVRQRAVLRAVGGRQVVRDGGA